MVDSLICAREKSGLFVGHTEAILLDSLATHNAIRVFLGMPLLILPNSLEIIDIITTKIKSVKLYMVKNRCI